MKTKEIRPTNFVQWSGWPIMVGGGFYLATVALWQPGPGEFQPYGQGHQNRQ